MTQTHKPRVTTRAAWLAACSLLTAVAPLASSAQQNVPPLSKVEQKIRDYVRSHEAEQINLLEKAVNISSGTLNLAGVRAVGKLLEPEFASLGFDVKWIALPDAVGRAGHLFAESRGKRGSDSCSLVTSTRCSKVKARGSSGTTLSLPGREAAT